MLEAEAEEEEDSRIQKDKVLSPLERVQSRGRPPGLSFSMF